MERARVTTFSHVDASLLTFVIEVYLREAGGWIDAVVAMFGVPQHVAIVRRSTS